MYTKLAGGTTVVGGAAATTGGTLAKTGFNGGWLIIASVTLFLAGASVLRMARKLRNSN